MANINKLEQVLGVPGHYEPVVSYTVLRGCRYCGGVHPLAREPKQPDGVCPDCGKPTAKTKKQNVKAQLGLPTVVSNFIKSINRNIKGDND